MIAVFKAMPVSLEFLLTIRTALQFGLRPRLSDVKARLLSPAMPLDCSGSSAASRGAPERPALYCSGLVQTQSSQSIGGNCAEAAQFEGKCAKEFFSLKSRME